MTSRGIVKRALEFASPPRIPRQLWLSPWATDRYPEEVAKIQQRFPDDIVNSPSFFKESLKTVGDEYSPGLYIDEWGCIFENRQKGVMGKIKEPLLKDWIDVDQVRVPRERLSLDIQRVNDFCQNMEKFVIASSRVRPFEQLQFIRLPENLFLDLVQQPDELFTLLERVHQFYKEELELWACTEVDALFFADDWGSQDSLLISPSLWRKIFKPLYKEYVDIAHGHDKYMFFHTDGHILDIFPDIIELGVDAINSQIFCMDLKRLGKNFKGKITFWGEIDRQHLLPFGTPHEVREAVKKVKETLYQRGGVIAQCEFGIGARPENIYAVFEAWESLGEF